MKVVMLRFPHLAEQILQKLDNEGLTKSREVEPLWQKFIDERDYPWLRIVNIPNVLPKGNTYLHLVAEYGQIDVFEMLLNEDNNTDQKNNLDETPFIVACRKGRMNVVAMLLKKSGELKIDLNQRDCCDVTAFSHSVEKGHSEIAKMIMDNSLQLKIDLNTKDIKDTTPFHFVGKYGHSEIAETMINNSSKLKIDFCSLDNEECTAFHLACYYGHLEVAEMILENSSRLKIDLNGRDIGGYTAFHLACTLGHPRIAEMIMNHSSCLKIEFNTPRNNGTTIFHSACTGFQSDNRTKLVEIIIEWSERHNIDLTAKDEHGRNGYHIAEDFKNTEVINLIKTKMPSLVM